MKTREEALVAFRGMSDEKKKELWKSSDNASCPFNLFKASTSAIQQAFNKKQGKK